MYLTCDTFIFKHLATEAKAVGSKGETEGDGEQDEGVRTAVAVHARVHRRLQGLDQPEAADVHARCLDHGHRHWSHLHLPLLASPGQNQVTN
jgi:hypothetical protein